MSMEHPDLGHGKSFFTDSPMWRNASLTCSCVADGAAGAPSNTKRHVSFKDCMSLIASIALPRHHQSKFLVHEVCVKCTNQCLAKPATPAPLGLAQASRPSVDIRARPSPGTRWQCLCVAIRNGSGRDRKAAEAQQDALTVLHLSLFPSIQVQWAPFASRTPSAHGGAMPPPDDRTEHWNTDSVCVHWNTDSVCVPVHWNTDSVCVACCSWSSYDCTHLSGIHLRHGAQRDTRS
jgi:hypothetical protein